MNRIINAYINRSISRAWKGYGTALFIEFDNGDWICNQADQWAFLENDTRTADSESSDAEMDRVCATLVGAMITRILVSTKDPESTRVTLEFTTGHVIKAIVQMGDSGCGIDFHEHANDRCALSIAYETTS